MHRSGRVLHVRSTVLRVPGNRMEQDPRKIQKGQHRTQLRAENGHGDPVR